MAIYQLENHVPNIAESAYIAPGATVIGRVTLGERSSVWPGAVIRADDDTITVGDRSNVQDGAVLHVDPGCPLNVGADVTIGHLATLHGCTIGDGTLVGLGAIVYNKAIIGRDCLIAAGAIVTEGKVFPDGSLILGVPAKAVRQLTAHDRSTLRENIGAYVRRGEHYRDNLKLLR